MISLHDPQWEIELMVRCLGGYSQFYYSKFIQNSQMISQLQHTTLLLEKQNGIFD